MKDIDFGKIERYLEDKGFGFVSRTFTGTKYGADLFFHIRTIRRDKPQLAQVLNSYDPYNAPYFWYEFEETAKGIQVISVVNPHLLAKKHPERSAKIIETIKKTWVDQNIPLNILGTLIPLPEPIVRAASEIIQKSELVQLEKERSILEQEKGLALKELEATKRKEADDKRSAQEKIEEEEFVQLVKEIAYLRPTHSREVSDYIVRHKLGRKYKNISGVLEMEMRGVAWKFNGGFPPKIYARLCDKLGLQNQGSEARPREFKSYKDLDGE